MLLFSFIFLGSLDRARYAPSTIARAHSTNSLADNKLESPTGDSSERQLSPAVIVL